MTQDSDLRQRNLDVFRGRSEALYQTLIAHRPLAKLVYDDDGQPDVVLNGIPFYSGKAREFVAEQVANFQRHSQRVSLAPPDPKNFDEETNRFLEDTLAGCVRAGVKFHLHAPGDRSYDLVIFGIGLGLHIKELIEKTGCFALLLVEPNREFLYHSLDVCDWAEIFDLIDQRGGEIRFVFHDKDDTLAVAIRQNIRNINPCTIDGLRYFFHYNTSLFQNTLNQLRKDQQLVVAGLGFFFDETIMITNAHKHLCPGDSRVYLRPTETLTDLPAFVIASGPSVDQDMAAIRELQDRAIIISCGSALRPLLKNGIRPDFQIELENIQVAPLIKQAAAEHDLSDVCLMTASTVDTDITQYFQKVIYYFRSSLSPYNIFCDTERRCLANPNPTVLNAGTSFAQELGFKEIYLFGADLSVKKPEQHHSKDAYQYTEGAIHVDQEWDIPTPGNFGGTVYSSYGLYWTRDAVINAIRERSRNQRYYNCSDGVFIEGMIARKARGIRLPEVTGGKAAHVNRIIESAPVYTTEEFRQHWTDEKFRDYANRFLDTQRDFILGVKSFADRSYLAEMRRLVDVKDDLFMAGICLLFRGTFFMSFIALEYYLARVQDPAHVEVLEGIVRENLLAMIEDLREKAMTRLGSLSEKRAAEA